MDERIMKETGKLGFGLMRLPHKGLSIDIEQTSKMVDMFIEGGGTYFDTAYVYQGSEAAAKKALVERHPRESYTLATKLNASMLAVSATEKMAKNSSRPALNAPARDILTIICCMRWTARTTSAMRNSESGISRRRRKRRDRSGTWDSRSTAGRTFWRSC